MIISSFECDLVAVFPVPKTKVADGNPTDFDVAPRCRTRRKRYSSPA
jgi:hypothetical protein